MSLIEAHNLCKFFRPGTPHEVRAVDDVSLTVAAGSITVLSGPSGSGKTTLLGMLGALARPTRGQIAFAQRELGACSDHELARLRRRMGFVFQDFSLLPRLPVWENVAYPLIPRGVSPGQRQQRAREQLDRLGLAAKVHERPETLSGGEQQRVAVARALVGEPEVILADEPTSNLDRRASDELAAIFADIHAAGTTLVLSTHDPRLAALASHRFELEAGRLRESK